MPKVEKCAECGGQVADNPRIVLPEETVAGVNFRVTVEGAKCRNCGENYVSAELLAKKELMIAERLLRGPASGAVLKYARKALALRAIDLADILRLDAATISRWETGKGPIDHAAWLLLWSFTQLRLRAGVHALPLREEVPADQSIDLSAAS